ncbi:hypothetical protein Dip510_001845 [Elusimicrobium posterum]|uniref:FIST C-terminal domain-containing protein n=1 Tax=Elusimicrobium posterum TaxID=3116653 RepID=UPI003C71925B
MIKTLTAYTTEIDNTDEAIKDILTQLDLENNLLKNTVGIISCYPEFIENGIVQKLSDKLPFKTMGVTTFACAVNGEMGQLLLTISVLTSDTTTFSTAVTEPLSYNNLKPAIEKAYMEASSVTEKKPDMVLVMTPFTIKVAGDDFVKTLDEVSGSVPIFGTAAVDDTPNYEKCSVIYNGLSHPDTLAMTLVYGDIKPEFSIGHVSEESILSQKAIITESKGNVLIRVNDMPALDYLKSLGLAPDGQMVSFAGVPLLVDFNDGTKPVARVIIAVTPEGHVVCGGLMPENTILSIGSMNYKEVLNVSQNIFNNILKSENKNGVFIFSCLARNSALGLDAEAEMQAAQEMFGGKIPFFMEYSGGEICPVPNAEGKLVNRFHNDTIVTCIF